MMMVLVCFAVPVVYLVIPHGLAHDESPGTIRPIVDYNLGIRRRTNICTRNLTVSL
jgi:hypothetical protein